MIYYKTILLLVIMMSAVCFSVFEYSDEATRKEKYKKCKNNMKIHFNKCELPINAVRKAMRNMKLYPEYFEYDDHIKIYYGKFQDLLSSHRIRLPEVYCQNNPDCLAQTQMFINIPGDDNIESLFTNDDQLRVQNALHTERINELLQNDPQEVFERYSGVSYDRLKSYDRKKATGRPPSTEDPNYQLNKILKQNVLRNALYYHVIYDLKGNEGILDEDILYFHAKGSYGANYLTEVARVTELKHGIPSVDFPHPVEFCKNLYPKPQNLNYDNIGEVEKEGYSFNEDEEED